MITARLVCMAIVHLYPCALCRIIGLPFSGLFKFSISYPHERHTPYTYNTHYSDREYFHRTVSSNSPVKHTDSTYTNQYR